MKGFSILMLFFVLFGACSHSPPAHADVLCEHRSAAHIAKYGGLKKDSAEHVAKGELPTCDPNPKASESKRDNDKHDDKSRYCKRKWYC